MQWNDEVWTNKDGKHVSLVRAAEDGAVYVNGGPREVSEGDLFVPSGSDTVGVYDVSEDDLRSEGFRPPKDAGEESSESDNSDDEQENSDDEPQHHAAKRTVPRKRS